jgi:hypothetical protein
VVLGPCRGGRVYLAGFSGTLDFEDAYAPPAVETLTARALDARLDVDYAEFAPLVETGDDLATLVSLLRAWEMAGRKVPERTLGVVTELGLTVGADGLRTDSS